MRPASSSTTQPSSCPPNCTVRASVIDVVQVCWAAPQLVPVPVQVATSQPGAGSAVSVTDVPVT